MNIAFVQLWLLLFHSFFDAIFYFILVVKNALLLLSTLVTKTKLTPQGTFTYILAKLLPMHHYAFSPEYVTPKKARTKEPSTPSKSIRSAFVYIYCGFILGHLIVFVCLFFFFFSSSSGKKRAVATADSDNEDVFVLRYVLCIFYYYYVSYVLTLFQSRP